jgi:phospholipid/cholesterol/gamma-HCH transport system substrate-binding protein
VAPDNRLIEVIMKIDLEEDFAKDTISQLKSVGITGLVFIELNRRDEGQAKRMVEIDFEAPYPVIPSIESDLSRIVSTIDQAISRIKEIDVQDTLEKVKSIANAVESVVTDGRLRNIMTNLDTSAARFSGVTEEMEKTLSETRTALSKANMLIDESRSTIDDMELAETASSFKDAAVEMKAALAEAQKLIADSRKVVKEMELAERSKDAEVLMEDLDSSARMAAVGIRDAGESVERAARALELFVQRLSENPSDILFGRPPRERRER